MPVKKGYGSYQEYKCQNCGESFDCTLGWGVSLLGTSGTDFCSERCYREFDDAKNSNKHTNQKQLAPDSNNFGTEPGLNSENLKHGCIGTLVGLFVIILGVSAIFGALTENMTSGSRFGWIIAALVLLVIGFFLLKGVINLIRDR